MGGNNVGQLIEYVRSYDPRGWTCLHIAEGSLDCNGVIVQNNDIGPCGSDAFQEWADGISVSCRNATVRNNMVEGATDGGIVVFGSPGSQIYNNTIWILNVSDTRSSVERHVNFAFSSKHYSAGSISLTTILGAATSRVPSFATMPFWGVSPPTTKTALKAKEAILKMLSSSMCLYFI